jgi:hypothetical protein
VPWRVTSKKPANVEIDPIAAGALNIAKVSAAPSTFSYRAAIPAHIATIPRTHGPAPKSKSMLIPANQLLFGLLRRFRRNAADLVATSDAGGMTEYIWI